MAAAVRSSKNSSRASESHAGVLRIPFRWPRQHLTSGGRSPFCSWMFDSHEQQFIGFRGTPWPSRQPFRRCPSNRARHPATPHCVARAASKCRAGRDGLHELVNALGSLHRLQFRSEPDQFCPAHQGHSQSRRERTIPPGYLPRPVRRLAPPGHARAVARSSVRASNRCVPDNWRARPGVTAPTPY